MVFKVKERTDIEFVTEPSVTLYKSNASDIDVARAAWVSQDEASYKKEKEEGRIEGLINFLWRNKHTSPFEHGQFTFIIDVPLFISKEFMRHRTFSYNEISGRYSVLPSRFYIPPEHRPLQQTGKVGNYVFTEGTYAQKRLVQSEYTRMANESEASYHRMLDAGICKEVARGVMLVTHMTTFWATVNPLNLMRFLDLRTDPTAQWEIQQVARLMEEPFKQQMPLTYNAWRNA